MLAFAVLPAVGNADGSCQKVLRERIDTCAATCLANAKAAVSPEIRDRIKGYGCHNNCAKLEMFAGHNCPPG